MGKLYAKMCINGTKNFNEIAAKYQKATKEVLEEMGYAVNEDGTVSYVGGDDNE